MQHKRFDVCHIIEDITEAQYHLAIQMLDFFKTYNFKDHVTTNNLQRDLQQLTCFSFKMQETRQPLATVLPHII